jgi:hypothetical protein
MNNETNIKLPDRLKESPFNIPNGYFDRLPEQIMQKCASKKKEKITLWKAAKPMMAFAAGFLLLVCFSKIVIDTITPKKDLSSSYLAQTEDMDDILPVLKEGEIDEEMKDEIINYIIDEQYISMSFIEDEYIPVSNIENK